MYKLIALDVDDTLLNSEGLITPRVKAAVERARAAGVQIVIATGRPYKSSLRVLDELNVSGHVICFGGAMVVDHPSGIVEFTDAMTKEQVGTVISFAKQNGVYIQVYEGDDYFFDKETEYSHRYAKGCGYNGTETDLAKHEFRITPKALIIDDHRIPELYDKAVAEFGENLGITISKTSFLELSRPTISKAFALDALARKLGIKQSETIAIGDSLIDLPMIEYAGIGIAMANGREDVRQKADVVCPSNDEDGVAWTIDKFIFGEE